MENVVVDGNGTQNPKQIDLPEADLVEKDRTGIVKFFNRVLGWGFIIQDLEEIDAFVHFSWVASNKKFKKLNDDDFVIYDLYKVRDVDEDDKKKWQARNVRKIKETLID